MSQSVTNLSVLGLDIAFRAGADMERVRRAARLVEERFAEQKLRARGGQSKESLLIFLALGFADDLLQSEKKQDAVHKRIASLLTKIEEFE